MDATNLDCRMVKSLYPENDSMVMAQVTKIQEDGVTFSLLEFNNREVRIVVANDSDCLARSKVGRIEPLKVMFVDKTFDYIAVKRSGTTFDERMKCEQLYNKRKHVHSVLHSIADEHDIDLEKLYELTRWPSYEALPKLREKAWLKRKMSWKLRSALVDRINLMQYFSWRIEAPWILNLCHFISKLAACWAYALVRHLEAYLKLKGKLSEQDYLSFQDFINKVPKDLIKGDGDISRIDDLADVVVNKGVVLKELCPMSNSLEEEPVKTDGKLHNVSEMNVHADTRNRRYEARMIRRLKKCPLTATVLWWESYYGARDDRIFTPTDAELRKFKSSRCLDVLSHVMLMTGHGVDRRGVRFLEFQDSDGDVGNCDRGFVRMALDPNPVVEYITLKLRKHRARVQLSTR